ncbi:MAG TPA: FAD-linked oxidase C-terminal domain-containing protein [Anaerolineales bacterium]|nr:FAD-linked oxidase C-terminal domain-containing protein [Anaerolineales bacterium]
MSSQNASATVDLEHALKSRLDLDARFDAYTRLLYSTDASNHQVEPLGIVVPRDEEELAACVALCHELRVPVLARGAGTSLGGQAIGRALILDCSRHLNRIHGIDPEAMVADVGPGVVLTALNAAARPHGLIFGPDPASADRATLGGMIANNSAGARSILYGMTADHLLSAEVVLCDGSSTVFRSLNDEEARRRAAQDNTEGTIYRTALHLRGDIGEALRRHWPRTWRRASGYSLNYLAGFSASAPPSWYAAPAPYPPSDGMNLAPLLAGSEGTLAVIRRASVRLVPRPGFSALVILSFKSVAEAADAAPDLLRLGPSAIELIPRTLLQQARRIPAYARKLGFVEGDPTALLVIEFLGDSPEQARGAAGRLAGRGRILESQESQAELWSVRKAGLGLLMAVPGDRKPTTFIEDVAVPVEHLGRYVRQVERILDEHGTYGEWYAHASAGCLHMRPLIDLKTGEGVQRMRSIADAVFELVLELDGAVSGEHGDGLSHTEFNDRLFGPELTAAFRTLKLAFDPFWLLNPGKILPSPGQAPRLDTELRYGPDYKAPSPSTWFAYRSEGDFARAVESCTGVGVCRKEEGLMCPSFQATREEMHSTRGRANALRSAISGKLPLSALSSEAMHNVLDLCLECKGCKSECPTAVDMARLKAEFLALYHAEHGIPLRSRFFGQISSFSRILQRFHWAVNALSQWSLLRRVMEVRLGIARQRTLPRFSRASFRQWFHRHEGATSDEPVVLFVDTYTEFNHPELGVAAVKVLEAAGYRVHIAERQGCCGRPMISKGMLKDAHEKAATNLAALADYARRGIPIVGLEPSCILTLRDEYLEFFPDDPRAKAVAASAQLIEELLTRPNASGPRPIDQLQLSRMHPSVLFHGHCHAKALVGTAPTLEMLSGASLAVEEVASGCCGMAGSFGYEVEHHPLSMQIGELHLFPAIRRRDPLAVVAASGVSCRTQILDGTGVRARHPIEILADALQTS